MLDRVENITFGVRFVRAFHIPEISGKITDKVLRDKKSPFGDNFFDFVSRDREGSRVLNRGARDDTRFISNKDDIIFSLDIDRFEDDYKKFRDEYLPYIVNDVIVEHGLTRVHRLGVIFRHKFQRANFSNMVAGTMSDNNITDPNDMMIRFLKKMGTMEGQSIRRKNDFRNAIFTFEHDEESSYINIDYQRYFDPVKEEIRDTEPVKFLDTAKLFIEQQYVWVKKYIPDNG